MKQVCVVTGTPEEVAFCIATTIDIRNSYLSGCDIYFDNGCDANGYMGQFDPFDPSTVVYDPEQKISIQNTLRRKLLWLTD